MYVTESKNYIGLEPRSGVHQECLVFGVGAEFGDIVEWSDCRELFEPTARRFYSWTRGEKYRCQQVHQDTGVQLTYRCFIN